MNKIPQKTGGKKIIQETYFHWESLDTPMKMHVQMELPNRWAFCQSTVWKSSQELDNSQKKSMANLKFSSLANKTN